MTNQRGTSCTIPTADCFIDRRCNYDHSFASHHCVCYQPTYCVVGVLDSTVLNQCSTVLFTLHQMHLQYKMSSLKRSYLQYSVWPKKWQWGKMGSPTLRWQLLRWMLCMVTRAGLDKLLHLEWLCHCPFWCSLLVQVQPLLEGAKLK